MFQVGIRLRPETKGIHGQELGIDFGEAYDKG